MEPNAPGYANYLTIGCRFVPNDQWLLTHIDTSWKISDVKRWLLAKCLPALFTPIQSFPRPRSSQRKRPVSPITFASRDQVEQDPEGASRADEYEEGEDDDDDGELSSAFLIEKYKYTPAPPTITPNANVIPTSASIVPAQYTLLAFSTGQILEDHNSLSWYSLHPHEFLELHYCNCIVKLPREIVGDYVQPYFEAKVWALKAMSNTEETEGTPKAAEKLGRVPEAGESEREKAKKRRAKLQWHVRWVIIHQGHFQLCIERDDRFPPHRAPLSSLVSLRGAEHLQHIRGPSSSYAFPSPPSSHHASPHPGNSPVTASKRIVCMKFRAEGSAQEGPGFWQAQFRRGSRDVVGSEALRKGSSAGVDVVSSAEDEAGCFDNNKAENTVVIVLDMLEDGAYNHILRVLHRSAPSASSSFFPASARTRSPRRRSYSPISFASGSSPVTSVQPSPIASPTRTTAPVSPEEREIPRSVRYPEWRTEVIRRARRAGLGDVGRAMEWAMFGSEASQEEEVDDADIGALVDSDPFDDEPVTDDNEYERGRGRSREKAWGMELESDSGSSSDESASEREWEGWEGDLFSQRARGRLVGTRDCINQTRLASLALSEWGPSGTTASSPSTDYTFPALDAPAGSRDQRASLTLPRQLSSYSSADSLLRRTIKRASPRKYAPARGSSPGVRSRPISPLAGQLDQFDDDALVPSGSQQLFCYPQIAYPSRQIALERLYASDSRGPAGQQRSVFPLSMTMTSITSTVSVGTGTSSAKSADKAKAKLKDKDAREVKETREKGKSKEKEKRKETAGSEGLRSSLSRSNTRKRSSTVQVGALTHKASSSGQSAEDDQEVRERKSTDKLLGIRGASDSDSPKPKKGGDSGSSSERRLLRPGKLKLSMSFAQVAALSTAIGAGSAAVTNEMSGGAASTSTSSFESPKFAHPDSSD